MPEPACPRSQIPNSVTHPRAQVADWAGNSVPILVRVYAKCLTDSEQTALRRIEEAEAEP